MKKHATSKLLKDSIIFDAAEVQQTSKPSEGESKPGKDKNASVSRRPSKKLRNGNSCMLSFIIHLTNNMMKQGYFLY